MTSILKNVYMIKWKILLINNKIKPTDVKSSKYINFDVGNNNKDP